MFPRLRGPTSDWFIALFASVVIGQSNNISAKLKPIYYIMIVFVVILVRKDDPLYYDFFSDDTACLSVYNSIDDPSGRTQN